MRRGLTSLVSKVIDGREIAKSLRREMKAEVDLLRSRLEGLRPPCLAMVVVGDRPDSLSYVRMKNLACEEVGITSETARLPGTTTQARLLALVEALNSNDSVDGILVQFPLPAHIHTNSIIEVISPDKDVDGLHPSNFGKLFLKGCEPFFCPCTPLGCIELLRSTEVTLEGRKAVVIGRSNIVGTPMAALLQRANLTVSVCHSKTKGLADYTQAADIVISAVGKPKIWTSSYFKPGCIIIDVGSNTIQQSNGERRVVGDVDFDSCTQVAEWITPVPGGVGPMTIAMLLRNTVKSWKRRLRL